MSFPGGSGLDYNQDYQDRGERVYDSGFFLNKNTSDFKKMGARNKLTSIQACRQ